GRGVAAEDRDGRGEVARRVDVRAVGADRDGEGRIEPVDASDEVLLDLHEGELAGRGVPAEDGDRVVALARDVDVVAVRAHGDGTRVVQPVDARDAVGLLLDERERAGRRVAAEDGDRVVVVAGGVDVAAVRADRHGARTGEPVDAPDTVLLRLDEGQLSARRVSAEDGDRVVVGAGRV